MKPLSSSPELDEVIELLRSAMTAMLLRQPVVVQVAPDGKRPPGFPIPLKKDEMKYRPLAVLDWCDSYLDKHLGKYAK